MTGGGELALEPGAIDFSGRLVALVLLRWPSIYTGPLTSLTEEMNILPAQLWHLSCSQSFSSGHVFIAVGRVMCPCVAICIPWRRVHGI